MAIPKEGITMIPKIKKRRNKTEICSAVKSNQSSAVVGQLKFELTVLLSPISYANGSKNVVSEQNYLLVVTEKKDQTITQSSLISFGGGSVGV